MKILNILFVALLALLSTSHAYADPEYQKEQEYTDRLTAMRNAFNEGDSARFFTALKNLEDYLLEKNDMHAYYNQRCNEIVFLMNRQRIFEAYKLAQKLSRELREKKLDSEMYMAHNMMGHIYRYCGNYDSARQCFLEAIDLMEKAGYKSNMPPIYMNIVNVQMDRDPEEALIMLGKALSIARESAPERVFDIETRRTAAYYELGDTASFLRGYEAYKEGKAQGLTSVHGRALEVSYLEFSGKFDEALQKAIEDLGPDSYSTQAKIYRQAGRWKEAYEAQKRDTEARDSMNCVILSNSMQGIQDELRIYDTERKAAKMRVLTMVVIIMLLLLLIAALAYIVFSRRRHMRQLNKAYQHALASDNMKSAFIQNVSHEVRTPLNIISGFAQVFSDPSLDAGIEERLHMAKMVQKNTRIITSLIDEMLELSRNDSENSVKKEDHVAVNALLREIIDEERENISPGVTMTLKTSLDEAYSIDTNATMLQRIVSALVNNAAKYTEHGLITIKAYEDGENLNIAVEDTGIGVPAKDADRIFDRFVKLDTFKVGIGLGLPLCRTTAERLGGTVRLDTQYTKGARFVVTLPINTNKQ